VRQSNTPEVFQLFFSPVTVGLCRMAVHMLAKGGQHDAFVLFALHHLRDTNEEPFDPPLEGSQDLTEYALLVVLIVLVAITAIGNIGTAVNAVFTNTATTLSTAT
jgi:Flp pilus assembly pilin Flp